MRGWWIGIAVLTAVGIVSAQPMLDQLDAYNVVWDSPSKDAGGTMPIGNGQIGLNVWWEENGDLQFFIASTEAWDEAGRLVKVGKVRIALDPNPVEAGQPFRQTLDLKSGTIDFAIGEGDSQVLVQLWVDANRSVIHINVEGNGETKATATIELWRTERKKIDYSEPGYFGDPGFQFPQPAFCGPDTLLDDKTIGGNSRIGWYHDTDRSDWYQLTAKHQGLEGFDGKDPLSHRIFGGVIASAKAKRTSDTALQSPSAKTHHFDISVLTLQPTAPDKWLADLNRQIGQVEKIGCESLYQGHVKWWSDFWNRSWIFISGKDDGVNLFERNSHPIRIGVDQEGQNKFRGSISRASVIDRAVSADEIGRMMNVPREKPLGDEFKPMVSRVNPPAIFDGTADFHPSGGLTLEAWILPEQQTGGGGRIIDKTTPGSANGFLLDTYPGNSLRLITRDFTLGQKDCLPAGQWIHVAATVGVDGFHLFLNGKSVAAEKRSTEEATRAITRGYILQRWITACAGRGSFPIKFNGSLFTVPFSDGWKGDPDWRRWGSGYWWQNTRLAYISLCATGDFEMFAPLFAMYSGDHLAVGKYRNQHHLKTGGAFLNECEYFWGHAFNDCYGFKRPADLPVGINESGYHRWEFTSGYELIFMMLDYFDYTQDESFLKAMLLPFSAEILAFYDQYYKTDANGKIIIHPAQALETWWDCTNPMPDIAGLTAVTDRLLAFPESVSTIEQRQLWKRLRDQMPPLPTRQVGGKTLLAPAEKFAHKANIENPELYAVFPFRLFAFNRPNPEWAIEAINQRADRGSIGWRQDDIFYAYMGMAKEAREYLTQRARSKDANSRFPAFWGPNFDWVPDQDHGGILMKAAQSMLMQCDGKAIYLLPAWPKQWDADFKLRAPYRTTVQGSVRGGKIENLQVDPPQRRVDVKILEAQ